METCDVCRKEMDRGYKNVSVYTAKIIKRGVSKEKIGPSSVMSEYGKISMIEVKACNRHVRGFWVQRLIPGFIALILLTIPMVTLVSLIPIWTVDNRVQLFLAGVILALIPVIFLVRRITYDGYIAGLLSLKPRQGEEGYDYFGRAKYRRIMRNLAKLDAMIRNDKTK